jgi:hypothetical protein
MWRGVQVRLIPITVQNCANKNPLLLIRLDQPVRVQSEWQWKMCPTGFLFQQRIIFRLWKVGCQQWLGKSSNSMQTGKHLFAWHTIFIGTEFEYMGRLWDYIYTVIIINMTGISEIHNTIIVLHMYLTTFVRHGKESAPLCNWQQQQELTRVALLCIRRNALWA